MRPTAIVIPCYDEEQRLPMREFGEFLGRHRDIALLFVDDGSRDGTSARLRELAAAHPGAVDVLTLPSNSGKAAAVRAGVLRALSASPRYVGYWDADLAAPLAEIPRFVREMEADAECVALLGARVRLLGGSVERRPLRHYLGRVFAALASLTLGLPVHDTQCGAKLFRVVDETRALFAEPFVTDWVFDVELLARLLSSRRLRGDADPQRGLREIPVRAWRDVSGSSGRARDVVVAAWDLLRIHRTYRPRG